MRPFEQLDRFEAIRYPDNILKQGAGISIGWAKRGEMLLAVTGAWAVTPLYTINMSDVDALVDQLLPICSIRLTAYLCALMPDVLRALPLQSVLPRLGAAKPG